MIMHAKEVVNMQDRGLDNYIFDLASFDEFFSLALSLHRDYKKTKNKAAFLQGFDKTVSFG